MAREIEMVLNTTVALGTIGLIYGPAGTGKTMALEALAKEKPGSILITITTTKINAAGVATLTPG